MEVYVDDMLVKSKKAEDHIADLAEMFHILRKYQMRLNPQKAVGNPPMLSKSENGETLILYLAVSEYSVSTVLVKEEASHQWPVWYVSKRLLEEETRYTSMEKLVYTLIIAAQKLSPCFQSHRIEVRTAYPLRHILHKPESSGRMLKLAVELGQFDLEYFPRTTIKGQTLADFILEFDSEVDDKAIVLAEPSSQRNSPGDKREELPHPWLILHIDGAVNSNGSCAGIVLISGGAPFDECYPFQILRHQQ
ncbi:uncharacterized protein LOC141680848 [Apium graveolens]|uniref:uncharacterized protein LOC141680848 n=1 Tax=Apium graveolens TaxID=4045 RepID=UPI003D790FF4